MSSWFAHPVPLLAAVTAIPTAAGLTVWWVLRHRKSAEEIERERRQQLVQHGRIIDGTILDWTEASDAAGPGTLIYRYDISGVTYECAQDLKWLKDAVKFDVSCLGMPASIRYDSKNPGNSIIVAETWSGLRRPGQETPVWETKKLQPGRGPAVRETPIRETPIRETPIPDSPNPPIPNQQASGSLAH